jgi:hypothetical protein
LTMVPLASKTRPPHRAAAQDGCAVSRLAAKRQGCRNKKDR